MCKRDKRLHIVDNTQWDDAPTPAFEASTIIDEPTPASDNAGQSNHRDGSAGYHESQERVFLFRRRLNCQIHINKAYTYLLIDRELSSVKLSRHDSIPVIYLIYIIPLTHIQCVRWWYWISREAPNWEWPDSNAWHMPRRSAWIFWLLVDIRIHV